ncbi:MAG: pyrH [Chlamydiia bacterium]|nr:pyrH [Chlamydiia bacterium]
MKYKRILLKLSGEALMGKDPFGISQEACMQMAQEIQELVDQGVEVAIVIGAGNIFRGIQGSTLNIPRTPADHMGMLGTIINGIAFGQALEKCGVANCIMSAIDCYPIAEPYNWQKALAHLEHGCVTIFVGGTGSPYFTTDTAAALRASEIEADIVIKATKVDGIYSKDPMKYPDAIRYKKLTFSEVLAQKLEVMDATSIALCMTNHIPILVFNMQKDKLSAVLENTNLGTLVI